jgi:hypothetical protein
MNAPAQPRLWDQEEFARFAGLTLDQVKKLRSRGGGPPFIRLGRQIRYNPAKIAAWLHSQEQHDTRPTKRKETHK